MIYKINQMHEFKLITILCTYRICVILKMHEHHHIVHWKFRIHDYVKILNATIC